MIFLILLLILISVTAIRKQTTEGDNRISQPISPCTATCSLSRQDYNHDVRILSGHQTWRSTSQNDTKIYTKSCSVICEDGSFARGNISCLDRPWSLCNSECKQYRFVPEIFPNGDCKYNEETRECYSDDCPIEERIFLINADLWINLNAFGWNFVLIESVLGAISVILQVPESVIQLHVTDTDTDKTVLNMQIRLDPNKYGNYEDFLSHVVELETMLQDASFNELFLHTLEENSQLHDNLDHSRYGYIQPRDIKVANIDLRPSLIQRNLNEATNSSSRMKLAFCLTGQLARLELLSKIEKIFIPNAIQGSKTHVFIYLDNELHDIKQTYWNYNYSLHLYGHYNSKRLRGYINDYVANYMNDHGYDMKLKKRVLSNFKLFIRLSKPSRKVFHIVNGKVPVSDKKYSGHDGPKSNYESSESRFQNNMRWMNGLRDCVKFVQNIEHLQRWHYSVVVRLRDDTYALAPWIINSNYLGTLTAMKSGSFRGINDHNLVLDRQYADILYRGLVEDYYLNDTLQDVFWGNAERRISLLVSAYNIPVRQVSLCEEALIPLRGLVNESYWRVHPLYARHYTDDCRRIRASPGGSSGSTIQSIKEDSHGHRSKRLHGSDSDDPYLFAPSCCTDEWMDIFRLKAIKV